MGSLATVEVMNIGRMLNTKIAPHHFPGQFLHHQPQHFPFVKTEHMDRSNSPHGSEHSQYSPHGSDQSQYSAPPHGSEQSQYSAPPHGSEHSQYSVSHMTRAYPSPNAMQAPMTMSNPMQSSMQLPSFPEMPGMTNMPNMSSMPGMSTQQMHQGPPQQMHQGSSQQIHQGQPQQIPQAPSQQMPLGSSQQMQQSQSSTSKNHPCSTCGKRFARRSDLSRHERIHSGIRPHACEYPNCGKMFIQRSALCVHERVHTGEKPHHCEICAKRFSDSSSLARHRRTHLGQRPYKCPYADCQKTFTRRTTLNRHQNHHSGTIEEAAAATAAALAASRGNAASQTRSEGDHLSNHNSPMSTPSPAQRAMSMSPSVDLSGASAMPRHGSDVQYMQNSSLPVHLRVGSPVSTPSASFNNAMRPTSHPTGYGPPSTLEPSLDQHQPGPASAGGSPHMTSMGWQSPSHTSSPSSQHANGFVYPDPADYPPTTGMNQMYYGTNPQMRRPQNGEAGPGNGHMG